MESHVPGFRERYESSLRMTAEEREAAALQWEMEKAERMNAAPGDLDDGYDCPKCLNRGVFYGAERLADGQVRAYQYDCECKKARASMRRMRASGLINQISRCRMDNFRTEEAWQGEIRDRAARYIADPNPAWWFIGGAVGAGKTHISTAICRAMIARALDVIYSVWTDEITRLKAIRYDDPEAYRARMDALKSCDVLYIDDLYKRAPDRDRITDADVLILYDILNHRYLRRARTLISSERTLGEIIALDEGIGSRIAELARGYVLSIEGGAGKNQRMREG